MENNCTLHKFILCATRMPEIIKVGNNLTKLWQQQFCTVYNNFAQFFLRQCIIVTLLYDRA